jgi:non-specific serine/threonine protein kinase
VVARRPENGCVYYSPRGLYEFQGKGIADGYLRLELHGKWDGVLVVWDTGTGKTHFAMALAGLLYEDGEIDAVLLVAEKGKIGEWEEDFKSYTSLVPLLHHGAGRENRFAKATDSFPEVLISTYETTKTDAAKVVKRPGKRGRSVEEGWLLDRLRGKRVLVVYDEMTKLKNRSSGNYMGHEFMLKQLAKGAHLRVVGLTATPVEKDYEDAYNLGRLLRPDLMPLVKDFEKDFVASRDPYGRPNYRHQEMHRFAALMGPLIIRKRKTDPDVIDQFPKQVEESHHIVLHDQQYALYEAIETLGQEYLSEHDEPMPGLWTVLRQIAGHPASLIHSEGKLAQQIVEAFGADFLRSVPSTKTVELINWLEPLVLGQGDKAVVFTFFGQSVLPLLATAMRDKKMRVFTNHGAMSPAQQTEMRLGFRQYSGPAVFLTSDAGARGLNLPEALYVVEYESALTFANRTQRLNRIHRIDSVHPSVTAMTFFADYTVEDLIGAKMIDRNKQHDVLLDDDDAGENWISAQDRMTMLSIARNRKIRKRA